MELESRHTWEVYTSSMKNNNFFPGSWTKLTELKGLCFFSSSFDTRRISSFKLWSRFNWSHLLQEKGGVLFLLQSHFPLKHRNTHTHVEQNAFSPSSLSATTVASITGSESVQTLVWWELNQSLKHTSHRRIETEPASHPPIYLPHKVLISLWEGKYFLGGKQSREME